MDTSRDPDFVTGHTGRVIGAVITDAPLDPLAAAAARETMTEAMGALVRFDGVVRNHDGGRAVAHLSYEAHPTAQAGLQRVAADVAGLHPVRVWAGHRTGPVPIGDTAFTVLVAAAHRRDAFAACEEVTDRVKAEVPIWKEQGLADGTTEWVGIG